MYLNEKNISKLKTVFYDFNTIKIETKTEQVEENVEDDKSLNLNSQAQFLVQSTKTETKTKKLYM